MPPTQHREAAGRAHYNPNTMSEKERTYERIERFLREEMDTAERADFERALAGDEALRRELRLHRELEATFGDSSYRQLRQAIDEEERRRADVPSRRRTPPIGRWWMAIAASVLLLIAVASVLWLRPSEPELFAEYFVPYPADAFRDGAETATPAYLEAYRQGRYAEAANTVEALPAEALTAPVRFYQAVALLADGRPSSAIPILDTLLRQPDIGGLQQPVEWYLALALLADDRQPQALEALQRIADTPGHYRAEEAGVILGRLAR